MNKKIRVILLCFILIINIYIVEIFAYNNYYIASEVSYTPSDLTWNVKNAQSALDDLKKTSNNALTKLKNTNIAKAIVANENTLNSEINKLATIKNNGTFDTTLSSGDSVSLSSGYYSGGTIKRKGVTNSQTLKPTTNSTIDMGAINYYRYINTEKVYEKGVEDRSGYLETIRTTTSYGNSPNCSSCYQPMAELYYFKLSIRNWSSDWQSMYHTIGKNSEMCGIYSCVSHNSSTSSFTMRLTQSAYWVGHGVYPAGYTYTWNERTFPSIVLFPPGNF